MRVINDSWKDLTCAKHTYFCVLVSITKNYNSKK